MSEITYEEASRLFRYCAETGFVYWRESAAARIRPGDRAGTVGPHKERVIQLRGKRIREHRLAWLLHTGEHAPACIDHRNGDRLDNRWSNLRAATQAENMQNMGISRRNKSGFTGVSWFRPTRKWRASIMAGRKEYSLGYFDTAEEAAEAYRGAKSQLHPFQPVQRVA